MVKMSKDMDVYNTLKFDTFQFPLTEAFSSQYLMDHVRLIVEQRPTYLRYGRSSQAEYGMSSWRYAK